MKQLLLSIFIVITCAGHLLAQQGVSGTVTDQDGSPLPGVNVVVQENPGSGTVTNASGEYTLSAPSDGTLVFSFVGYVTREIPVNNRTQIDVTMQQDVGELQEVVVTAFGLEREKKSLGYSVTELEGEGFTKAKEINIADALAGKVSGVNVSNMATGPSGSSRVIIRGNTSISGDNQPLYVVDGIPMDNSNFGQAGMWGGADEGEGTSSINPDDIKSISVLKGGAAAAMYGSRASNGVILITTKKGAGTEGISIDYSSEYQFETIYDHTDYQTQYGNGSDGEAPGNASEGYDWSGNTWGARIDEVDQAYIFDGTEKPYENTFAGGENNFDRFYRTGQTWTNSLSVNAGGEHQSYRFSTSYMDNKSPMPNAGYKRVNAGVFTTGTYGNFEMQGKVMYANEDTDNRPRVSDSPGNPHVSVFTMSPTYNVEWFKGDPDKPGAIWEEQTNPGTDRGIGEELSFSHPWKQNPYWAAYQFKNSDTRDRVIGHAQARYNFTDELWVRARAGMDFQNRNATDLTPYGTSFQRSGSMNEIDTRIRETNFEWMAGYDNTWGEFGTNLLVGGNAMKRHYESLNLSASDFNIPFFHSVTNGGNQSYGYGFSESGINSLFGTAEFSYGNYLFLTATGRNDWFSTLNPETNDIFYPSVSLSYVFSDMFELPSWFTFGKARAAWAQVGGGTNPYQTNLTYSLIGSGHLGRPLGAISQSVIPNPTLKPLTKEDWEFGIDFRFLENRLRLDMAYYQAKTTDDILDATISQGSGFGGTKVNIGEMVNKGIETLVEGTPVQGQNFSWDVSVNFALNNNEVERLDKEGKIERLQVGQPRTRWAFIQHIIGKPYSSIVGFTHAEIDGQKVYDPNTGFPIITDTLSYLGNGVHKYSGGLRNDFSYKNFRLSFLLDTKLDGDIYSGTNVRLTGWGLHKQTLEGRENGMEVSGVDPDGETVNMTVPPEDLQGWWGRYSNASNYFVYDASYIKLRQVSLGYSLPNSVLTNLPFSNVNFSLVGRNLWLIYGNLPNIDPEMNYQNTNAQGMDYFGMPQTRSYGFNLSVSF